MLNNFFSTSPLRSLGFVCSWVLNAYKVFNCVLTKVGMLREAEVCDLFSVLYVHYVLFQGWTHPFSASKFNSLPQSKSYSNVETGRFP